eukprot:TRINITY_DN7092_c0_g1_i1.p1 TRINITY_DN7092_c0_g1~~TRINITY_DN7092_c0_g1_i1.p1  ORF type:complete len:113 (-),score=32.31 TRINITY_DN7092_c0_g1_i1:41-379(-)
MDHFGKSDPYVLLDCDGRIRKTEHAKKTLSPTWNSTFEFDFARKVAKDPPPLKVTCFDKEAVRKDKEIGSFTVDLKEFFANEGEKSKEWYKILDKKGKEAGEIHLEIWTSKA